MSATPSNITQQNSSARDLVNLVSSLLSITPSKTPSEAAVCLHIWAPLLSRYHSYGLLCVSFTTAEEWKEHFLQGKQNGKRTTDTFFIVFVLSLQLQMKRTGLKK